MTEKEEERLDKIGQIRIGEGTLRRRKSAAGGTGEMPRRSRRRQKKGGGLKRLLSVAAAVVLAAGILTGVYFGVQYWKDGRIPETPQESQAVIIPETMGGLPAGIS